MLNLTHRRINNYTKEVARIRSVLDYYQKVLVITNLKEAFGESGNDKFVATQLLKKMT